jgi:hypothetical protein
MGEGVAVWKGKSLECIIDAAMDAEKDRQERTTASQLEKTVFPSPALLSAVTAICR